MIGLGLTGISYLVVGHSYAHGPGLHHIIILFTFLAGALWVVIACVRYLIGHRTASVKGMIMSNLVMFLGFVVFMAYILRVPRDQSEFDVTKHAIRVEESGDTTIIYHKGSIVYVRVADSVLLNFLDSTHIDRYDIRRSIDR